MIYTKGYLVFNSPVVLVDDTVEAGVAFSLSQLVAVVAEPGIRRFHYLYRGEIKHIEQTYPSLNAILAKQQECRERGDTWPANLVKVNRNALVNMDLVRQIVPPKAREELYPNLSVSDTGILNPAYGVGTPTAILEMTERYVPVAVSRNFWPTVKKYVDTVAQYNQEV